MTITITQTTGADATIAITGDPCEILGNMVYDPDFVNRARFTMAIAAQAILGEDSTVPNHTSRRAYAIAVKADPMVTTTAAMFFIVADSATFATSTDQALTNRVMALWDFLSATS